MSKYTIQFNVSGYIEQAIEIIKEGVTIDDILEGLATGRLMTTIHDEDPHIRESLTDEVVAKILDTEDNCDYDDFTDKDAADDEDYDGL